MFAIQVGYNNTLKKLKIANLVFKNLRILSNMDRNIIVSSFFKKSANHKAMKVDYIQTYV